MRSCIPAKRHHCKCDSGICATWVRSTIVFMSVFRKGLTTFESHVLKSNAGCTEIYRSYDCTVYRSLFSREINHIWNRYVGVTRAQTAMLVRTIKKMLERDLKCEEREQQIRFLQLSYLNSSRNDRYNNVRWIILNWSLAGGETTDRYGSRNSFSRTSSPFLSSFFVYVFVSLWEARSKV